MLRTQRPRISVVGLPPALTPQRSQVNHWVSLHFQLSRFEHAELDGVIH